ARSGQAHGPKTEAVGPEKARRPCVTPLACPRGRESRYATASKAVKRLRYSGLVIRSSHHSLFKASTSGLLLLADFASFSALGSSTARPVAFDRAWRASTVRLSGFRKSFAANWAQSELFPMHAEIFSAESP